MIYRFGPFELDLARVELRCEGEDRPLEPQVFALLVLLVEQRDRVLSRDALIEAVWDGRPVSDAAVASRIRSARQALGDDGSTQRYIRTVHGRGYHFVADVSVGPAPLLADAVPTRRPSIAVLPFRVAGGDERHAALAHALPHELIAELSRLRWLFVTARGTSFRFEAWPLDAVSIGRLLGVRYCLRGGVDVLGPRLTLAVELLDTQDGGIIWADRLVGSLDDIHGMREEIRARILTSLEIRIPLHEASLARLSMPEDLDAWSAFHLGLQHVYTFRRAGNAAAAALFGRAVALDPGFARAHAGLSFVHFQTAFLRQKDDLAGSIAAARRCAERALELDPLDPFVNFTMGRSYWLEGDLETSLGWLERATAISPSYAQGFYARAWSCALSGRAEEGRRHVDLAMRLSPLDPLHYAMLGTRAFTHMDRREDLEAAGWAERAARSPGAHVLIAMIAAVAQTLAGNGQAAAPWVANVRERNPTLRKGDFLRAFPIQPPLLRSRVSGALATLGF
jgi:TolB-like protein